MTIEQAVAILEAERVLQYNRHVRANGAAWRAYVQEAGLVIQSDPLLRGGFNDLHSLRRCPCGAGCDGTGDCEG